jgi:RecB family exonuclease
MPNPSDSEERLFPEGPFLSHSQINKYLQCPEQYRLHYVENLRPRLQPANLVFGQVIHQALAHVFKTREDPQPRFRELWEEVRQFELKYSNRDSWESLERCGTRLLEKFITEELSKFQEIHACEKTFEFTITGFDLPFVGVIDLVGTVQNIRTVVDFKTASSRYEQHEVVLSDQLTAYRLAEPEARQLALCVLLKTKEPQICWYLSERSAGQLTEYLHKLAYLAHEIAAGRFYKRPGKWCGWCDFLPVCLGDKRKTEETLVKIR